MTIEELRVGNWVIAGSQEDIVDLATFGAFRSHPKAINHFHGIPLTEEWLERLGFEADPVISNNYFIEGARMVSVFVDINSVFYLCESRRKISYIPIEYVHQIQNIFFFLRGTELTIKEKP